MTLAVSLSVGCGRDLIGADEVGSAMEDDDDDDGVAEVGAESSSEGDQPACEGPYCRDPANCGAPRVDCVGVFGGIGECIDGVCAPALLGGCASVLFDPPEGMTCVDVCGFAEATCVEDGCLGHTAYGWPDYQLCETAYRSGDTPLDVTCDEPLDFSDPYTAHLRCCCVED